MSKDMIDALWYTTGFIMAMALVLLLIAEGII